MKIVRFVALILLLTIVHGGLFGEDSDVAKRRKRLEDEKAQKRSGKAKKRWKEKQEEKKKKRWFGSGEEEDPDAPIEKQEVQEILQDTDFLDTVTAQDDPNLNKDELYKIWAQNMHDFVPEDLTNFVI